LISENKLFFFCSRSCSAITDDGLAALAGGCKKIRTLNIRYCAQITDGGLKHISSLEELTSLEMRCLVRVTGIGIASIATGCPNLVELDLKRCYSVDDASIGAVARYSQNLRQVKHTQKLSASLCDPHQEYDNLFVTVLLVVLQLDISYCQVTSLGLCRLLSSLGCLEDLKMVHVSWVSIEGFEMALRAAGGRLKKVKMWGGLRSVLSPDLLQTLQACGCRVRWMDKPFVYKG
jgi:F-box and leucine-rich repeat protein 2/20